MPLKICRLKLNQEIKFNIKFSLCLWAIRVTHTPTLRNWLKMLSVLWLGKSFHHNDVVVSDSFLNLFWRLQLFIRKQRHAKWIANCFGYCMIKIALIPRTSHQTKYIFYTLDFIHKEIVELNFSFLIDLSELNLKH